jgi:hypothetical protein
MANYASAGGAYGVGIPALALGSLAFLQNGGLGNLFGVPQAQQAQQAACAEKDAKIARLEAERYADGIVAQVYKAGRDEKDALIAAYINPMAREIADIRVREAETAGALNALAQSTSQRFEAVYREIDCAKKECGAAIALEGERRTTGDQSIMCYVQGNFVPGKLIMPASSICPPAMPQYNSWVAPATSTTTTG